MFIKTISSVCNRIVKFVSGLLIPESQRIIPVISNSTITPVISNAAIIVEVKVGG